MTHLKGAGKKSREATQLEAGSAEAHQVTPSDVYSMKLQDMSYLDEDGAAALRDKKKSRNRVLVIIACILLALSLAGLIWFFFLQPTNDVPLGGWFYDQSAEEIQAAVDHEVEDGYFNMSINTSVPVYGDNTAIIGIKNIASNQFDCIVTVTLDDDGTEVYRSGGLAPGNELAVVTLNVGLDKGDHAATALFEIYERDDSHEKVGQTASKITFHVQ